MTDSYPVDRVSITLPGSNFKEFATVTQRQCTRLVSERLWVRFPPVAPASDLSVMLLMEKEMAHILEYVKDKYGNNFVRLYEVPV